MSPTDPEFKAAFKKALKKMLFVIYLFTVMPSIYGFLRMIVYGIMYPGNVDTGFIILLSILASFIGSFFGMILGEYPVGGNPFARIPRAASGKTP